MLYSAFVVALTGRCDEEVLSLLLKLPENNRTSLVVDELCSLPALDLYTMFVLIIQNLNVRHIMYKVRFFLKVVWNTQVGRLIILLLLQMFFLCESKQWTYGIFLSVFGSPKLLEEWGWYMLPQENDHWGVNYESFAENTGG